MITRLGGTEMCSAVGETVEWTEMTKLKGVLRNFVKAPKNEI